MTDDDFGFVPEDDDETPPDSDAISGKILGIPFNFPVREPLSSPPRPNKLDPDDDPETPPEDDGLLEPLDENKSNAPPDPDGSDPGLDGLGDGGA